MELLKLLSAHEFIAQAVCFLLLVGLLRFFLWRPVLKALDARRHTIEADMKAVARALADAETVKADYASRLDAIQLEARAKMREAVEEGKRSAEELKRQAYVESQRIIEQARSDVRYELQKAKEELKGQIVDMTIQAAEAVIQDRLTEEGDRKIVRDFLDKVDTIE